MLNGKNGEALDAVKCTKLLRKMEYYPIRSYITDDWEFVF